MPETTYYAHTPTGRVPVDGARDAEYLSRRFDVRITANTEGSADA